MVFARAKRFHAEQGPASQGVPGMQNSVVSLSINFIFLNKHYLKRRLISQFSSVEKTIRRKKNNFTVYFFMYKNLSKISFLLLINKNSESNSCLEMYVLLCPA